MRIVQYILRNNELVKQNTDLHNQVLILGILGKANKLNFFIITLILILTFQSFLQLSKLHADLAAKGNISNFAKFVEIKNENSFLKVIQNLHDT